MRNSKKKLQEKYIEQNYLYDSLICDFGQKTHMADGYILCNVLSYSLFRLLLGIMYVTGFLSLWISNTAATSMMLPISVALAKQLTLNEAKKSTKESSENKNEGVLDTNVLTDINPDSEKTEELTVVTSPPIAVTDTKVEKNEHELTTASKRMMKGFCLAIAY